MMEANPAYLASLKALNPVDKAQLLYGNWDARPQGASFWEASWVENNKVDKIPEGAVKVRAYDLAATERSQANKHPDPTGCIGLARTKNGRYIMYGDYHKDTYDEMYNVYGQYCKRSGARDLQIAAQGHYDGRDTTIILPIDPGAAGKTAFTEQAKFLMSEGLMVKRDPTPNNKSKMVRFLPFATATENGLVDIWWDSFDKKTRDFIFKQLEAFDGERSTNTKHDEFPDCLASAFNYLCQKKIRGRFSGSGLSSGSSKLSAHKSRIQ
ncbi:terminase-like family protein [Vibrio phage 1.193.O._10N.286.52.C6]|nr:terminase-like family protein [Vibrio phage 1.193.O._10N.286.52.C6]